eukprot:7088075-Prymnesium_polylepis.1
MSALGWCKVRRAGTCRLRPYAARRRRQKDRPSRLARCSGSRRTYPPAETSRLTEVSASRARVVCVVFVVVSLPSVRHGTLCACSTDRNPETQTTDSHSRPGTGEPDGGRTPALSALTSVCPCAAPWPQAGRLEAVRLGLSVVSSPSPVRALRLKRALTSILQRWVGWPRRRFVVSSARPWYAPRPPRTHAASHTGPMFQR